ncbi:MAG TPA: FHA domain-containing protein [Dermatophilaceae bacterium]|jgi:hypothetical protein|nr:FHA domain-containing protein [Dermatophilaceae bacterium]HMT89631.1 FHA domain-containing protein [Dermatophilaceae bacterium]
MSELTLTVFRLGLVVLLWFFVFSVVGVLRTDLYGTRVSRRSQRAAAKAARAAAVPQQVGPKRANPVAPGMAAGPGGAAGPGAGASASVGYPGGPYPSPAQGPQSQQSQQQQQQQKQHGARPAYPSMTPQRGRGSVPTTLVVTEGRLAGTSLPLTPAGILIGRNPECALVLDDDFASGRHARLIQRNGSWQVEDLGSTNGTQLDGHRLTGAQPVAVGSTLRIGRTTIELRG